MLNPELRELYSSNVIVELEKLAADFEKNNTECWVYGLKDMYGIKAPEAVYYDNKDDSVRIQLFRMCQRYTDSLSPEEDENFGGLVTIGHKELWFQPDLEKSKPLYVK